MLEFGCSGRLRPEFGLVHKDESVAPWIDGLRIADCSHVFLRGPSGGGGM